MNYYQIGFLAVVICAYAVPLWYWRRERKRRKAIEAAQHVEIKEGFAGLLDALEKRVSEQQDCERAYDLEVGAELQSCGHHLIHAVIVVNHPEDGPQVSCEVCDEQMPKVRAKALTEAAVVARAAEMNEARGFISRELRRMAEEKS